MTERKTSLMSRMIDSDHPFFIPLWRRVAVTAFGGLWALYELTTGAPFWGVLIGGIAVYCFWAFFFAFNPREPDEGG